jgi:hypothetical protein
MVNSMAMTLAYRCFVLLPVPPKFKGCLKILSVLVVIAAQKRFAIRPAFMIALFSDIRFAKMAT